MYFGGRYAADFLGPTFRLLLALAGIGALAVLAGGAWFAWFLMEHLHWAPVSQ